MHCQSRGGHAIRVGGAGGGGGGGGQGLTQHELLSVSHVAHSILAAAAAAAVTVGCVMPEHKFMATSLFQDVRNAQCANIHHTRRQNLPGIQLLPVTSGTHSVLTAAAVVVGSVGPEHKLTAK